MIALIAALTPDRVIGRDNAMPWHIPDDLRHFKRTTRGKPVIMGRRSFESIGRPLPERTNIVLSRDPDCAAPGCQVVNDPEAALSAAGDGDEIMVIGGAAIYELFLPRAERLYLTWIQATIDGDTLFPAIEPEAWRVIDTNEQQPGPGTPYPLVFQTLQRIDTPNGTR